MSTIVTRAGKGSPLTWAEADANFTNLNTDKVEGQAVSVDSEVALFSGTGGKTIKRATNTGLLKAASGVIGTVVSGTDIKTINGVTVLGSGDITAGSLAIAIVTATSQTAVAGTLYVLTNAGVTTVTLPASPADGDSVGVKVTNTLTTNVIARNAKSIEGAAEDMTIDQPYATITLRYIDSTRMWRIV